MKVSTYFFRQRPQSLCGLRFYRLFFWHMTPPIASCCFRRLPCWMSTRCLQDFFSHVYTLWSKQIKGLRRRIIEEATNGLAVPSYSVSPTRVEVLNSWIPWKPKKIPDQGHCRLVIDVQHAAVLLMCPKNVLMKQIL